MRLYRWAAGPALLCAAGAVVFPACDDQSGRDDGAEGTIAETGAAVSVQLPEETDVAGFQIVVTRVSCNGEAITPFTQTLDTTLLDLDITVKGTADGSLHPFADTFIPLEEGCYDILSMPVQADGSPSEDCAIAGQDGVVILDGTTTEIVLVSQCDGQVGVGAVDVISTLNRPPQIIEVGFPGGKFTSHCDAQQICATFFDPDADPIDVVWTQIGGVPLASLVELPATTGPDGTTQCIEIDHAGPGMVILEAVAYDLMQDPGGSGLIPFEHFYEQNGIGSTSHDSLLFNAYGASGGECACAPNPEVCDGVDNDCDGEDDEGLPGCACAPLLQVPCYDGPPGTEGVGLCDGGMKICAVDGSGFGPCVGQVTPQPEVCPGGEDEDCNGEVDDCCGPGGCCVSEAGGSCQLEGDVGQCYSGVVACDGRCEPAGPLVEECNGVDDDCDGLVDEGAFGGAPCSAGVGPCEQNGVLACIGGVITCNAVPGNPSTEVCDNQIDEDCDGMADDGCPGCSALAGSPCTAPGVYGVCATGHIGCDGICVSDESPAPETCNGIDDDCDGQIDEGGPGALCGGVQSCQAGACVCPNGWQAVGDACDPTFGLCDDYSPMDLSVHVFSPWGACGCMWSDDGAQVSWVSQYAGNDTVTRGKWDPVNGFTDTSYTILPFADCTYFTP